MHAIDHYRSRVFADQILEDNVAAISFARAQSYTDVAGGVAMLGFCGGGWSVLRQATQTPDVRAVVALYAAPAFRRSGRIVPIRDRTSWSSSTTCTRRCSFTRAPWIR